MNLPRNQAYFCIPPVFQVRMELVILAQNATIGLIFSMPAAVPSGRSFPLAPLDLAILLINALAPLPEILI